MFNHIEINLPEFGDVTDPDTGHRYYLCPDGNKYDSITTILKSVNSEVLNNWKKRVGNDNAEYIRNTAADYGKKVHKLCERYLNNEEKILIDADPIAADRFLQIRPYVNKLNNIHLVEKPLYSTPLKVAGSCDIIGEYDGTLAVVDFKPNNSKKYAKIYPGALHKYWLQTNGYARMYEFMTGIRIDRAVIIVASTYQEPDCIINDNIHEFDDELNQIIANYYKGIEQ